MQVGENPAFYLNFWFPYMWAAELTLGCIPVQLNCERHLELTHRLLGMDASGEKFYRGFDFKSQTNEHTVNGILS